MEFFVKRAGYNTFDVFAGKQWSSWSRLKAGRNGVYVAMGEKVDHTTTRALAASINPKLTEQFVTVN
jgi:hypothetical protein